MQPFSPHARFFSSIEQLKKRITSESHSKPSSSDSLDSPLYLHQPNPLAALNDSSGPPLEFLSNSPQEDPSTPAHEKEDHDHIEHLLHLLGLSRGVGGESSCGCSRDGFYFKIAGVKGPRCDREMRRLEGWIEYYYRGGGEGREPARLVHLLLAKAACGDDGFGESGFPLTVQEFLEHDPPEM